MINYIISGFIALALSVGGWLGVQQISKSPIRLGAQPAATTFEGGTGTSSPSGILYGDSSIRLKTVSIGSNLTFSGGTLSSTGGGSGDGNEKWATSTVPTKGIYPNSATHVGIGTTSPLAILTTSATSSLSNFDVFRAEVVPSAGATTTALKVDSNGVVLLGQSVPAQLNAFGSGYYPFQISASSNDIMAMELQNISNGSNAGNGLFFDGDKTATSGIGATKTYYGGIAFSNSGWNGIPLGFGALPANSMAVYTTDGRLVLASATNSPTIGGIDFYGGSTGFGSGQQDMVLNTAGNLGLGTTSPRARFTIAATSTFTNLPLLSLDAKIGGAATTSVFMVDASGTVQVLGSTTLQNFTGSLATTTNATTTNLFVSGTASTTLFFGSNINTCQSGNFLTYSAGLFGCSADSAGGGTFPFTPATTYNTNTSATTTPLWFQATPFSMFASSTAIFTNASSSLLSVGGVNLNAFQINSAGSVVSISGNTSSQLTSTALNLINNSGNVTVNNNSASASSNLTIAAGTGATSNIIVKTSNSERARFDGLGNLGIGTTTPRWNLQVASTSASNTMNGQLALTDNGAATNKKHWIFSSNNGNLYFATSTDVLATSSISAFWIDSTATLNIGNIPTCNGTSNALGTTNNQVFCDSLVSDIRLKKDIKSIDNGLDIISQLNPVLFSWKDLTNHNTTDPRVQQGFIAQEVQKVIPSAVGNSPDGYLTLDKTAIIPYLVDAVQKLSIEKGLTPIKRSAEENWQWIAITLLVGWNITLTIKKK